MATRTDRIVSDGRTFSYVLYAAGDTQLTITQNDVRAIQLAKAALRAGIDLLVEHAGSPVVTDIRLAGAFGAHIDPVHAMVLGLVPDCPVDGVRSVGNAAGAGAVQALLSRRAAGRDGGRRAPGHQDRDRHRTAVPGTVRRGDGAAARDEPVAEPVDRGRPPRSGSPLRRVAGAVAVGRAPNRRPARRSAPDDVPNEMSWRMCHERTSRASWWWSGRPPEHAGGRRARPLAVHHAPSGAGRA